MKNTDTTNQVRWTEENIMELIRKLRNDLIKDFLDERNLLTYYAEQYNRKELTVIKIELIKKELKQMLIDPVDRNHYRDLIQQIKETGAASISTTHEGLFLKDIEKILKQYAF